MSSESSMSLPPVAKSFYTFCKKCDADRYHIVLAHTSAASAKIECEICHSKKTYSLPKAGAKKTASGGTVAPKRTSSMSARMSAHNNQFESLMNKDVDVNSYNMKTKYAKDTKIDHPKFGIGFVTEATVDRIEVVFKDEVKTLLHNRQ